MAREKEDYRANMERLNELFPNHEMLSIKETAGVMGVNEKTVKKICPVQRPGPEGEQGHAGPDHVRVKESAEMSRVEHGERIRSRQREIVLRVTLIFVSLILLTVSIALLARTASDKALEAVDAQEAPEVRVIVRYATEREQEEHDQDTLLALARTVWGEARGCTTTEQAAVVWCVLNRVDSPGFPDDILEVLEQPNQFSGYDPEYPVWPEILALVEDVLDRWKMEKTAVGDVGRVLPKEYVFFEGKNGHNQFRTSYRKPYDIWDWSLSSPYEEGAE